MFENMNQNPFMMPEQDGFIDIDNNQGNIDIDFSKIELSDFSLWESIIFWFVKNEHYAPAYYFSKIFSSRYFSRS